MLDRSPARDHQRDAKRERRREQARERQRRKRQREESGEKFYRVCVSPVVIKALIARSEDAGHTKDEAERASRDRKKITADLANVIEHWARLYLAGRDRA